MSKTKTWNTITLEDILRVDAFDQQVYIHLTTRNNMPMVQDKREFFTQIYAETSINKIEIKDGSQLFYREVKIDTWLDEEISKSENSLVIFLEGYAGCGKSTFVQNLLRRQLNTYDYEANYYNYDIGAVYGRTSQRIVGAIRECFVKQLMECVLLENSTIIDRFQYLLSQEEIRYLDSTLGIYNEFGNTSIFKDGISYLKISGDRNNFRSMAYTQLKSFSCDQILSLDFIFRLSRYIESKEDKNTAIYVCYDNLDSIENFVELKEFSKTLVAMRKNIDEYINKTLSNYTDVPIPHFVMISTYRKITTTKVDLYRRSERIDDYSEYNAYIQYIDASYFYFYYDIVTNRKRYFTSYIKRRNIMRKDMINKLEVANKLTEAEFVHNRYAGLWNNNYRTCSTIFDKIFRKYQSEAEKCVKFIKKSIDGYDEIGESYFGASAIFLSLVCKIFYEDGLWGPAHMDLIPLNSSKQEKSIYELTTLYRLILTYMSNVTDKYGKNLPVSTEDIFREFGDMYSPEEICGSLSNMLNRNQTDTWRRPIYYYRNPINDDENIKETLMKQWEISVSDKKNIKVNYTEFLLCECGYAYIERLASEFEFFSNRVSNANKSLYFIEDSEEIKNVIKAVYNAVRKCCEDLMEFSQIYMKKKGISSYEDYICLGIHPKTHRGKTQLHTERIIFSHIAYLDHCRHYHIEKAKYPDNKKEKNGIFVLYISKYLELYKDYILPIDTRRKEAGEELCAIVDKIITSEDENVIYQPISRNH